MEYKKVCHVRYIKAKEKYINTCHVTFLGLLCEMQGCQLCELGIMSETWIPLIQAPFTQETHPPASSSAYQIISSSSHLSHSVIRLAMPHRDWPTHSQFIPRVKITYLIKYEPLGYFQSQSLSVLRPTGKNQKCETLTVHSSNVHNGHFIIYLFIYLFICIFYAAYSVTKTI
jgi:hypothetical protein